MIPVLTSEQIRKADSYTIQNEPIASIDLMERASHAFVEKFESIYEADRQIKVFAGTGNNGGDGLVVTRLLRKKNYTIELFIIGNPEKGSPDFKGNLQRVDDYTVLNDDKDFPEIKGTDVVIDAIFGSGLTRPVEGIYGQVINRINDGAGEVVALDIASGLFSEQFNLSGSIIQPKHTISFQVPKLAFFQPSLHRYVGKLHLVDIGLNKDFINDLDTDFFVSELNDMISCLPARGKYDHKGDAGRVQIISGSKGKMGAAILASRAALRSGLGLLFVQTPDFGVQILQQAVPEAMVISDQGMDFIKEIALNEGTDVVGIGPGLDMYPQTSKAVLDFIHSYEGKLVLDADALNILSKEGNVWSDIPEDSILTPHPGEFKRMVGDWHDDYEKLKKLKDFATTHKLNVVLKGANSAVCNSEGKIYFNPTGNPGMATGGSGDVLFGMICGLYSQKISGKEALLLGVFLHGLAGDLAVERVGFHSLIASDLVEFIPEAFKKATVNNV